MSISGRLHKYEDSEGEARQALSLAEETVREEKESQRC
jgi:hypothetical protein